MTEAVLLHQAQKDPEYIKIRLRWVSNAFQEYLRKTEDIMKQHFKTLRPDSLLIQLGKLSANNLPREVGYGVEENPSELLLDEDEDLNFSEYISNTFRSNEMLYELYI